MVYYFQTEKSQVVFKNLSLYACLFHQSSHCCNHIIYLHINLLLQVSQMILQLSKSIPHSHSCSTLLVLKLHSSMWVWFYEQCRVSRITKEPVLYVLHNICGYHCPEEWTQVDPYSVIKLQITFKKLIIVCVVVGLYSVDAYDNATTLLELEYLLHKRLCIICSCSFSSISYSSASVSFPLVRSLQCCR